MRKHVDDATAQVLDERAVNGQARGRPDLAFRIGCRYVNVDVVDEVELANEVGEATRVVGDLLRARELGRPQRAGVRARCFVR